MSISSFGGGRDGRRRDRDFFFKFPFFGKFPFGKGKFPFGKGKFPFGKGGFI